MKNFIEKNWVLIAFIITALIDQQQGVLESIIDEKWIISLIRLVGSIILAKNWNVNPSYKPVLKSASVIEKEKGAIIPNRPL